MNLAKICVVIVLMNVAAWSAPLGSSARTVIPSEVQQLISVDYRALKNSDTAAALQQQVMPESLKQFETALKGVGIDPDKDVDQLTFVSYRAGKQGLKVVGVAEGSFSEKIVLRKIQLHKIKPAKYHNSDVYNMAGGMQMTFLDDNTLLFGDTGALRGSSASVSPVAMRPCMSVPVTIVPRPGSEKTRSTGM